MKKEFTETESLSSLTKQQFFRILDHCHEQYFVHAASRTILEDYLSQYLKPQQIDPTLTFIYTYEFGYYAKDLPYTSCTALYNYIITL